jgi:hypothetical protein
MWHALHTRTCALAPSLWYLDEKSITKNIIKSFFELYDFTLNFLWVYILWKIRNQKNLFMYQNLTLGTMVHHLVRKLEVEDSDHADYHLSREWALQKLKQHHHNNNYDLRAKNFIFLNLFFKIWNSKYVKPWTICS